jgi:hypothetical protein
MMSLGFDAETYGVPEEIVDHVFEKRSENSSKNQEKDSKQTTDKGEFVEEVDGEIEDSDRDQ